MFQTLLRIVQSAENVNCNGISLQLILRDRTYVEKEKEKIIVTCLRPPQSVKLGSFTW